MEELRCPISLKIMKNPVRTKHGFVYERKNIEKWFACGNVTEPMTNQLLDDLTLEEDKLVKDKLFSRKVCTTCKTILKKPRVCSKCMFTCYCSVDCQKRHWIEHKNCCKLI